MAYHGALFGASSFWNWLITLPYDYVLFCFGLSTTSILVRIYFQPPSFVSWLLTFLLVLQVVSHISSVGFSWFTPYLTRLPRFLIAVKNGWDISLFVVL